MVLIAHADQRSELLAWLDEFARDTVHVIAREEAPEWELAEHGARLHLASSAREVYVAVRGLGALDVIVDLLPADRLPTEIDDHLDLWERLFRFLRRGGAYVLARSAGEPPSERGFERFVARLTTSDDPRAAAGLRKRDRELLRSAGTLVISRDLVIVTKRLRHHVKILEAHVNRVLVAREPQLQVTELVSHPAGQFDSRARVTHHESGVPIEGLPGVIDYPEARVRHYRGPVALAGATLMYSGHSILPDSFRWPFAANPSNPRLKSVSPTFARIESRDEPKETLEGDFYQLDCAYAGHFGHIMTEVVSRLWGWDEAKARLPDLKAVLHLKPGAWRRPALEIGLFTAYGIAEEDIVWVNQPVWLDSVVSSTPQWQNEQPHYVNPGITDTWHRITRGLLDGRLDADEESGAGAAEKIFVSRGGDLRHRSCRNSDAVEALFESRGFEVVCPEQHSLQDQAAMFAGARVIAGFGGSAMFNMMHARRLETALLLNHESYRARNEHLYTSVLGADVHYFWSAADVEHPPGGWSTQAFYSNWEFDFARNGPALTALLDGL